MKSYNDGVIKDMIDEPIHNKNIVKHIIYRVMFVVLQLQKVLFLGEHDAGPELLQKYP